MLVATSEAAPPIPDEQVRSFTELYVAYKPRLLAYLHRAFPRADAQEVAQETMRRAFTAQWELLSREDPWPWLAVTARNLVRTGVRNEQSRTGSLHVVCADTIGEQPHSGPSPEDQVITREQLGLAYRAMDSLSRKQRSLLHLMIHEDLSCADAGRRLGMTESSARQHLCRLRSRLWRTFTAMGGNLS